MPKRKRGGLSTDRDDAVSVLVKPRNEEQEKALEVISKNTITFIKGAPGTGKTYLAISHALDKLLHGQYEKLVLSRPVVEAAGEKLGFLPGDIQDKIDPYMIPIFETLSQLIPHDVVSKMISKNGSDARIRILPLAYMRGITFKKSFIISDEMQNSTPAQVRMLLTRIGEKSKMVICGDVYQSDIQCTNGLLDAFSLLAGIDGIGFVSLSQNAIVRHPLIQKIEERYQDRKTR